MDRGTSTLIAGFAAALALPLLKFTVLEPEPIWLSGAIALGIFFGIKLLLRPPARIGLKTDAMLEAQSETVRELIADGSAALARMKRIAPQVKDPAMRGSVQRLATTADAILGRVRSDPARAMIVRRFLTFYLPNAASIAEGWHTLEGNANPSPQRVSQTRDVMQALNEAFAQFATDADAPELQELDLNLKVVKDALKADLEKSP
jgi:hypothetical protein